MIVQNRLKKRGFSINLFEGATVEYLKGIWGDLGTETKQTIVDNLVYLKLSPYSMFLDKETYFDSSLPYLKELGDRGVVGDMPRIAEEDKSSTKEFVRRFKNKRIRFRDTNTKVIDNIETDYASLIGMSFGKDSLLSYGITKEVGLKPRLVMVQDFWDLEAEHKFDLIAGFEEEFDEDIGLIYDRIDDVSVYKRINVTNSEGIVGANAMNSYVTMLLPLAIKHQTKYIIFGNEQNFNDHFTNNEGFKAYPSYEQTGEWMIEQNKALNGFTKGNVQVSSLIEPLYNIAEFKVLFNRYPAVAKYQMSCSLSNTRKRKDRWCYNCPMCAKAFLFLKACGVDPKIVGFNKDLFDKQFERLYPLFSAPARIYEKPKAVRDEQLFAFYLAYKDGHNGCLVDKFKKVSLDEAKEREDELFNKFFKVHDAVSIPDKLKGDVNSIYREELNN